MINLLQFEKLIIFFSKKTTYKPQGNRSTIFQHFGIFYAMGFALIFEGILSACYHVCPTNENFQVRKKYCVLKSILPNFDFFVFLIVAMMLGYFKVQTIFYYAINTQAYNKNGKLLCFTKKKGR
jgi:hypothetical protein